MLHSIKNGIVVVAGTLLLGLSPSAFSKPPNILLVVADDLGWTDLGSFGSEIPTPNLDALAENGVMFTDFHVSVSCSPTRSMLLTGTDNHLAGLGNMGELITSAQRGQPGYEGHLNDRVESLAEALKANGYHTYMAGKWHLGHDPEQFPAARGFDHSLSMLFGGASYWSDMFGMLAEQEPMAEYVLDHNRLTELPEDFYATRNYTDFLIDNIRQNLGDGKPFLAYLAFTAPHDPLHVPEPWKSVNKDKYNEGYEVLKEQRTKRAVELGIVPNNTTTPARHKMLKAWESLSPARKELEAKSMEVYAGMVQNMDYHFGRVTDYLKDVGEYDNTLVIFMSDNGANPWYSEDYPGNFGSEWFSQFDNSIDNIGEPMSHYAYGMGWGSASGGPLSMFKMTVAEGGIRSPLIIDAPGIQGGRQINTFAYVWDIMPTILDFANVGLPGNAPKETPTSNKGKGYRSGIVGSEYKAPEEATQATEDTKTLEPIRGKSLHAVLTGALASAYTDDEYIGGEMQDNKWVRQGNFKAVKVAPPYGPGKWELYNLSTDIGESNNLAKELPEMLKEMKAAWNDYAKEVGVVLKGD